jgi:oligopeptide transport system permease protein
MTYPPREITLAMSEEPSPANKMHDFVGTPVTAIARRGLWSDARRRLRGNRAASAALIVIAAIALLALIAPVVSPWRYDSLDWQHLAQPPGTTAAHWLGTDRLGRDLLVRTLYGVRLSLMLAVFASALSLVIGVLWGAVAGLAGGRVDGAMMRFVDVLYSLPYLFVVIILTTLFPRGSLTALLVALGAVGWLTTARIVRAQTLALKGRAFIEAARAGGVPPAMILRRHVVPNVLGSVLVYATLIVPQMILFESFLSFLGLGVQEPHASLGNLIYGGAQEMESAPWMLLVPAAFLVLLLLCLNLLGDGLRDALDPRER